MRSEHPTVVNVVGGWIEQMGLTQYAAWAPKGADRFYNLVKNGYFNDTRFFRVVRNFMGRRGAPSHGI